jgi:hypothetical protein
VEAECAQVSRMPSSSAGQIQDRSGPTNARCMKLDPF